MTELYFPPFIVGAEDLYVFPGGTLQTDGSRVRAVRYKHPVLWEEYLPVIPHGTEQDLLLDALKYLYFFHQNQDRWVTTLDDPQFDEYRVGTSENAQQVLLNRLENTLSPPTFFRPFPGPIPSRKYSRRDQETED